MSCFAIQMSEKELIISLKFGSKEAFNLLFHMYERRIYAFSLKLLLSREDAEEVVQEVFFKIWKNKRFLKEDLSFKAYLFTVAKNHIYNLMSKRVSETAYKLYSAKTVNRPTCNTEEELDFDELNTKIQGMIQEMPEKRQKVFVMSRFQGLSNREIADQLSISLSTVENHINCALKVLKQRLISHDINILLIFILIGE